MCWFESGQGHHLSKIVEMSSDKQDHLERAQLEKLKHFLHLPEIPHANAPCNYRFREPGHYNGSNWPESDLSPFVMLSDQATETIAAAHPDLYGEKRYALYHQWQQWNKHAFLVLEKQLAEEKWAAIAVSIILPISETGFHALKNGKSVLALESSDMTPADETAKHLLLDTWIIEPAFRRVNEGYGRLLVLKHLSNLWDPGRNPEMKIMAEPDHEGVRQMAELCYFVRQDTPGTENLYVLDANAENIAHHKILRMLAKNIEYCRQESDIPRPAQRSI